MQNFRYSLSIYHVVFYKPGLHFKKRKGTSKAEQRATGAANDHTGALAPAHGPLEATGRPGDTITVSMWSRHSDWAPCQMFYFGFCHSKSLMDFMTEHLGQKSLVDEQWVVFDAQKISTHFMHLFLRRKDSFHAIYLGLAVLLWKQNPPLTYNTHCKDL